MFILSALQCTKLVYYGLPYGNTWQFDATLALMHDGIDNARRSGSTNHESGHQDAHMPSFPLLTRLFPRSLFPHARVSTPQ